jgi:hypothetical protein
MEAIILTPTLEALQLKFDSICEQNIDVGYHAMLEEQMEQEGEGNQ